MSQEALNRVGDRDTIDQQNRVNREEVQQGNQFTRADTKVLFNYFCDVFTRIFAGQHKASQTTVGEEGHREGEDCHDDQWDHPTDTCVDWQEQYARTDSRAIKAQHPHGIGLAPCAS